MGSQASSMARETSFIGINQNGLMYLSKRKSTQAAASVCRCVIVFFPTGLGCVTASPIFPGNEGGKFEY